MSGPAPVPAAAPVAPSTRVATPVQVPVPLPVPVPVENETESDEEPVAAVFTWPFGGTRVAVAGSWDNWRRRTPLARDRGRHTAVLLLPSGTATFKYYVDGAWSVDPSLATRRDAQGNTNNSVTVCRPRAPSQQDEPAPSSPPESYNCKIPHNYCDTDADVPVLPSALSYSRNLEQGAPHVRLEHTWVPHCSEPESAPMAASAPDAYTRTLKVARRYGEKTITTVYVTPF